jgi:hypothetical protein
VNDYERGVSDEQARVIALFDDYDITQLQGGVILLEPKRPDRSWEGTQHRTGSLSSYIKRGCRCEACVSVAREWRGQRADCLGEAEKVSRRERKTVLQRERRMAKKVSA